MDHVFFGSDFPVFSSGQSLTALRSYSLTNSELQGVLGGNVAKLLKLITASSEQH